jgi:threonine/homoserine/homoserine lactone efflux protein
MAPGPITATTIGKGNDSPYAGALIAVGHGIVEFPLMIAVYLGAGKLFSLPAFKLFVGIVGGLFLLYMGVGMLRSVRQTEIESVQDKRSPITAGILLTIGNPYFLVWWATIGAILVFRSVEFGLLGFVVFSIAHWTCDLIWYFVLGALAFKGGQFFGNWFQRVVFVVCGVALLFFGGKLIFDVASGFLA